MLATDVSWRRGNSTSRQVPVIVLDHLTETQKRAYILADNKLALNAGWHDELLGLELAALKDQEYDLGMIGFDDEELARLLAMQDATALEGQVSPSTEWNGCVTY